MRGLCAGLAPLLTLELHRSVRGKWFFRGRELYCVLLLGMITFSYSVWSGEQVYANQTRPPNFAREFFEQFALLQLTVVLLIGPAMAGGLIARERQQRTLEALLITPLSALEIVSAKFILALLKVGNYLLLGVPVLTLTLLLGGVGFATIAWMLVVTLSTLVSVIGVSLGISVHCRQVRTALVATYLAVFIGIGIIPYLIASCLPWMFWNFPAFVLPLGDAVAASNPYSVLRRGILSATAPTWSAVAPLLITHGLLALAGLLEAVRSLRRADLLAAEGPKRATALAPARRWKLGRRAVLWKEIRSEGSVWNSLGLIMWRTLLLAVASLGAVHAAICIYHNNERAFNSDVALWAAGVATLALVLLTMRAARSIAQERENQTWEPLLLSPLSGAEILVGKGLGCIYSLRWEWGLVLWLWLLMAVVFPQVLPAIVMVILLLGTYITFCTLVGLTFSLRLESGVAALGWSLLTIGIAGSGCGCCLFPSAPFALVWLPSVSHGSYGSFFEVTALCSAGMLITWLLHSVLWFKLVDAFDRYGRTYVTELEQRKIARNLRMDQFLADLKQRPREDPDFTQNSGQPDPPGNFSG